MAQKKKDAEKLLSTLMDIQTWQKFQDALSMMTGLSTVTLDPDGNMITQPSNYNDFCLRYLRHSKKGRTLCARSHLEAARAVSESGKPTLYECHAGFKYFAVPVMINNAHITTIVGGQIIGKEFSRDNLKKVTRDLDLNIDDFEGELQRIQSMSEEQFVKAKELLETLVGMITQLNFKKYGLTREVAELSALHEITSLVGAVGDFDKMMRHLSEKITQLSGVERCTLVIRDQKIERFLVATSMSLTPGFRSRYIEFTRDILFERRLFGRDSFIVENVADIIEPEYVALYKEFGIERRITIPLVVRGRTIGIIELYPEPGLELTKERMDFFTQVAYQAGVAIDNASIFSHAERLATTDGLTGLLNYRTFHHQFALEIKRARRYKQMLSVLMLDIDEFKAVNDTYGHLLGNVVLSEFANILRQGVREVDIVARYGGEEFVIVLPETPGDGAEILGERLRQAVADYAFSGPGAKTLHLTVSVGVASYHDKINTPEDLLDQADTALLAAKLRGKNRFVRYTPAVGREVARKTAAAKSGEKAKAKAKEKPAAKKEPVAKKKSKAKNKKTEKKSKKK